MHFDDIDRRRFLLLAAAPLLAAQKALPPHARESMLQMNGYAVNAETPLELLTDYRTPNELFFVRSHWIPRTPDPKKWRLTIDGEVDRSTQLTLSDLKKLPRSETTCVLQCAGNGRGLYSPTLPGVQWRYGAVGNARWSGVRVRDVLDRAGVKATARHLHTFGSDDPPGKVPPFHRSIEMEKVLADGILAFAMNGEPLSSAHGAPLRLVVPGWAGDHWMKWVVRLSPQAEAQKGFYMETAYRYPLTLGAPGVAFKPEEMSPVTVLFVKSNITTAPKKAKAGHAYEFRGFAFSGAPDIAKVEISDDDGATWQDAALDPRHEPYAWRLWSYRWTPSRAGAARICARATDSRGSIQPREAAWNQSGYLHNSWHFVDVEVAS
ncbi:MAG: sulfite oxidase [Thermoanaerobaculia bacterium]|jgi:DMSO/TMAO reductase YedYZ molybdopterin-dependent catalytic subunit|nr:sulfite oxidase [Thermoanaerobaculia bacterium]